MVGFILLLLIFSSIWAAILSSADIEEVKKNWSKYRCRPNIMPFASFYGHNTAENFQFCLMNLFGNELGFALGPVFQILGSLVSSLVLLIQVANSIRLQFATMMGGMNTLFQNFTDRFKQLLSAVQMSAYRMKLIMGRLYGAFFAMIYMSIAGMTAVQNFTDTTLFSFLDTFCFDPDTPIEIQGKGLIPIRDAKIGDILVKTKGTITSVFQFEADGQPMVTLPGNILVSTNHYIESAGRWIPAGEHPDAKLKSVWSGGTTRPLICLNTSDHRIPIGSYLFLDYDETEKGDQQTMQWVHQTLNGKTDLKDRKYSYTSCLDGDTLIKQKDGSTKSLQDLHLGDSLTTGRVIGVVQKQVDAQCTLQTGEVCAPGLCIWKKDQWIRAGDEIQNCKSESKIMYNVIVLKSACFETENGTFVRDYVEVHSPEGEQFYAKAIEAF